MDMQFIEFIIILIVVFLGATVAYRAGENNASKNKTTKEKTKKSKTTKKK